MAATENEQTLKASPVGRCLKIHIVIQILIKIAQAKTFSNTLLNKSEDTLIVYVEHQVNRNLFVA